MSGRARGLLALLLAAGCAHGRPEAGLVALFDLAPRVELDIRYAGPENFVGAPVDGYEEPICLLTAPAARALAEVQRDLEAEGLGLRVFDCYRPERAVAHFVRWARDTGDERTRSAYYPRVPKAELFARGYVAERSGHSRGSTVDLTLVERLPDRAGLPLDMGTPFDLFDERSHTESQEVGAAQRANRLRLRAAMERRGFRNYPLEWWHYTLLGEPHPEATFDAPVRRPTR